MSPRGVLQRIKHSVRADCGRLRQRLQALAGRALPGPGLYHYLTGAGGRRHLHLRLHPDRTALIFIDAVHTIHLSPTDGEMAWLVLEGVPAPEALERLRAVYPDTPAAELQAGLQRVARLVHSISRPGEDCHLERLEIPQPPPLSVRAQAPYKVDLALHYACDNRCSHCYNEPGRRDLPSLDEQGWCRVLDLLWGIGVPYVIFTGGEPCLHPALPSLVQHAAGLGMITGVNTNGRRLADLAYAQALAEAGLDHVQTTILDHQPQAHDRAVGCAGAFAQTVAGISNALACGLRTLTNTTLTRHNAAGAVRIVDFVHSLGVRIFAMNGMIHSGCGAGHPAALPAGDLEPTLDRVRQRADELGMRFLWYTPTRYCQFSPLRAGLGLRTCNAAEYSICIEPNGEVLPCQSWYQPVGNILRGRWQEIWYSPLFQRIRNRREQPEHAGLPVRCGDCAQLTLCGGGCLLEQRLGGEEAVRP